MSEPNIVILSDRAVFRDGVVRLLQSHGLRQITGYAAGAPLLSSLAHHTPQWALIDMEHGADAPFPLLQELRRRAPGCTAMILGASLPSAATSSDGTHLRESLEFDPQLLTAVASLAMRAGERDTSHEAQQQRQRWSTLTPRQREVLGYLSSGSDNLKIAAHLGISERAVKAHVSALLYAFNVENRTELAVLACRAGVRPPMRNRPTPPPVAHWS